MRHEAWVRRGKAAAEIESAYPGNRMTATAVDHREGRTVLDILSGHTHIDP
jgi:hypothetical protein